VFKDSRQLKQQHLVPRWQGNLTIKELLWPSKFQLMTTRQLLTQVETKRLRDCKTKVRHQRLKEDLSRHQLKRQMLKSLWVFLSLQRILEQTETKQERCQLDQLTAKEREYPLRREALEEEAQLDCLRQQTKLKVLYYQPEPFQLRKHL